MSHGWSTERGWNYRIRDDGSNLHLSSDDSERLIVGSVTRDLCRELLRLAERNAELEKGHATERDEVSQILGKALGYPAYADDQKNFPGATEKDGACVGEHVPATLAAEAAKRIAELNTAISEAMNEIEKQEWSTFAEAMHDILGAVER